MPKKKKSSSSLKKDKKKKTPSKPSIEPGLKSQNKESVNNVKNDESNNKKVGITSSLKKPSHENNPYSSHSKVSFHPDVSNSHKTSKADFSSNTNNLSKVSSFDNTANHHNNFNTIYRNTSEGENVSKVNSNDSNRNRDKDSSVKKSHDSLVKKKSSNRFVNKLKSKLSKLSFKKRKNNKHNESHTDTSRGFKSMCNNNPFNSFCFPDSFYTYSLMNQDYASRSSTRDMYLCDGSNRSRSNTGLHQEEKRFRIFDILPRKKYTPENLKDLQMFSENLVRFCEDLSEAERIVRCREQSQFVHIETMVEIASRNFVEDLVRLDDSLESTLEDGRLLKRSIFELRNKVNDSKGVLPKDIVEMAFGIMRTFKNFPTIKTSPGCATVLVTSSLSTYIKGLFRQVLMLNKEISLLADTVVRLNLYGDDDCHAFKTRRNKTKKSSVRKLSRSLSKLSRKIERMSNASASSKGNKYSSNESCSCDSSCSRNVGSSRSAANFSQISTTDYSKNSNCSDVSCQCDKKHSKNKRIYNIEIKCSRNNISSISCSYSEKSSSSSN